MKMKILMFIYLAALAPLAIASDCEKTTTPLANALQQLPFTASVIESQIASNKDSREVVNRTSIHFKDNSTAQITQTACYLSRYNFRIEYPKDDKNLIAQLPARLNALVAVTPLATQWQALKFDYATLLTATVGQALQAKSAQLLVLDEQLSWNGGNGEYATGFLINAALDDIAYGTQVLALTIEIGPDQAHVDE